MVWDFIDDIESIEVHWLKYHLERLTATTIRKSILWDMPFLLPQTNTKFTLVLPSRPSMLRKRQKR